MAERERCPTCRSTIWYPTDAIGRVSAWCDTCRAAPPTAPVSPPISRPALKATQRRTALHKQRAEAVLTLLQSTGTLTRAEIHRRLDLPPRALNEVLPALVHEGQLVMSRVGFASAYSLPESGVIAEAYTLRDRVFTLLDESPDRWWSPREVAEALGVPITLVYAPLSYHAAERRLRRRIHKQRAEYTIAQ